MDDLLCDEVWLSSTPQSDHFKEPFYGETIKSPSSSLCVTKQDFEQSLAISFEKELSYMPLPGYKDLLHSDQHLFFARFRAIQWFMKSRTRLNLSFTTVFNAANYLDRFLSMNQCHEWKYWMVELLSVACLSVAVKFSETCYLSLQEIQMEEQEHSFKSNTIQEMELKLLKALGWRLGCTNSYSYVEMLTMNFEYSFNSHHHLHKDLAARSIKLLLGAMLDSKFVEYRASVIAICALWCSVEEVEPVSSVSHYGLSHIATLFDKTYKDDARKCHKYMVEALVGNWNSYNYCPSSPVTVLLPQQDHGVHIYDNANYIVDDVSHHFKVHASSNIIMSTTLQHSSIKKKKKEKRKEREIY